MFANPDEKYYGRNLINYGADSEIELYPPTDKFNHLKEDYWCGGLGDCYRVNVIRCTEENLAQIEIAGYIPSDKRKKVSGWSE